MIDNGLHLHVLLVEDDKENLELLKKSLPEEMNACRLHYDPCDAIEEIPERLKWQRYDLVLTDIYKDRAGQQSKTDEADAKAGDIVATIRGLRFCPIIAFTDGSFPASLSEQAGPFLKLVDKSSGNVKIENAMKEMLATGIPQAARKLHDELDEAVGPRFLWGFLENKWGQLQESGQDSIALLERLIRRRASIQIGRLEPTHDEVLERKTIFSSDYYIMPPISQAFRLGHIIRHRTDKCIYVLLTPHCYLEIQPNSVKPRADFVLLVRTLACTDVWETDSEKDPRRREKEEKKLKAIQGVTQSPAHIGRPDGRYWFLPRFLDIPDSYCDFLQVKSVSCDALASDYEALAVLDAPFAEAFQSCFTSFYASVGIPSLDPKGFLHLCAEKHDSIDQAK